MMQSYLAFSVGLDQLWPFVIYECLERENGASQVVMQLSLLH